MLKLTIPVHVTPSGLVAKLLVVTMPPDVPPTSHKESFHVTVNAVVVMIPKPRGTHAIPSTLVAIVLEPDPAAT
jgi:hypothetical protein